MTLLRISYTVLLFVFVGLLSTAGFTVAQPDDETEPQIIFQYISMPDRNTGTCAVVNPDGSGYEVLGTTVWDGDNRRYDRSMPPVCFAYFSPDGGSWFEPVNGEGVSVRFRGRNYFLETNKFYSGRQTRFAWMADSEQVLIWNRDLDGYNELDTGELIIYSLLRNPPPVRQLARFDEDVYFDWQRVSPQGGPTNGTIISPSGEYILFTLKNSENVLYPNLYLLDMDGSITPLLKDVQLSGCSAWSPDGTHIAYSILPPMSATVNAASANVRSGPGQNFGVLTTATRDTVLEMTDRRNGFARVVIEGIEEAWISADLLTITGDQVGYQIETMDIATGESRVVADGFNPSWFPFDDRIIFETTTGALAMVNSDGTNLDILSEGGSLLDWSPNGEIIAYIAKDFDAPDRPLSLYLLDLNTREDRVIAVVSETSASGKHACAESGDGSWAPDSQHLIWTFITQGPDLLYDSHYYVCDLESCSPVTELVEEVPEGDFVQFAFWGTP